MDLRRNYASFDDILGAIKCGSPVLVFDEHKEQEADLIVAIETVQPETVTFMLRHGSGLLCAALLKSRLAQLGIPALPPMNRRDDTPFHYPVDAVAAAHDMALNGTSSVSAVGRWMTARMFIDPQANNNWFVSPGHLVVLGAQDKLLEARRGHTEASVTLAKLSGLYPAALLTEVLSNNGKMAEPDELVTFSKTYRIPITSIVHIAENAVHLVR